MDNDYDYYSRSIRYGLFATLPLFLHSVITETNLILSGSQLKMVLTAELILQKIATLFELFPPFFAAIIWIAFLFLILLKERDEMGPIIFELNDFKKTIFGALPLAGILLIPAILLFLVQPHSLGGFQKIFPYLPQLLAMKSGAAFFEEFLCRVMLLGGSLCILQKFKVSCQTSYLTAVLFSSLAFAELHYFHFTPWIGDAFGIIANPDNPYTFTGFIFRFLSGGFLGWVYIRKGFATTAWTHALYGYFQLFLI